MKVEILTNTQKRRLKNAGRESLVSWERHKKGKHKEKLENLNISYRNCERSEKIQYEI